MSDPYRTAPPSEWPKSLRAAFRAGYTACGLTFGLGIRLFMAIVVLCIGSGAAIGWGVARDAKPAPAANECVIRSQWDFGGNRYRFSLRNAADDAIGRFDGMGDAVDAAARLGCKLRP